MTGRRSVMSVLTAWHKTRAGLLFFAVVELGLAYGFGSWAIDSGSLWHYAAGILLFVGFVRNVIQLIRSHASKS